MIVRGRVTTLDGDTPVPDATEGEMRLLADDSLHATVSTNDGFYEYTQNGSPGPFRIVFSHGGKVRNSWSKITGPSGPVDIGGLPLIFRAFRNGVISGLSSTLGITASGANMNLTAAIGACLVQGIIYDQLESSILTIGEAGVQPRIDTIVVRVVPPGAGEDIEGRSELAVVPGTPAASPVAPTLIQTAMLWEFPLYDVAVGAGVTAIGSDKLTDRRIYTMVVLPAGSVGTTELADGSVTSAKILDGTIATVDIADNAITAAKIAANAVGTSEIADGSVTAAKLAVGSSGQSVLMPGTEYVATGGISSGTRTLVTLGVGPIPANVPYAVFVYHGVTLRNDYNTGTVVVRANINGGTQRTHEFQSVGGVPRWAPVNQTAVVTRTTVGTFNVTGSVVYQSGDQTSIRAGWIQALAIPLTVLTGG